MVEKIVTVNINESQGFRQGAYTLPGVAPHTIVQDAYNRLL